MPCLTATWSTSYSESILNPDNSQIYSLFVYGSGSKFLFLSTFDSSTGTESAIQYKSNIAWNDVYGSVLNGKYIIATVYWGGYYLTIFNINTSVLSFYSFTGNFYRCNIESSTGR